MTHSIAVALIVVTVVAIPVLADHSAFEYPPVSEMSELTGEFHSTHWSIAMGWHFSARRPSAINPQHAERHGHSFERTSDDHGILVV